MITSLTFPAADTPAGRLVRELDGASSPLGPHEHWPRALLGALNLMLASPEGMLLVWGEQRVLFANDSACAVLGIAPADLLGQPADTLANASWNSLKPFIEQALAGQSNRCERLHVEPLQAWWSLSSSPVAGDSGHVEGAFCVLRDLTAQIQADKAQQYEQAFTQRVLASINDCIKVLDLESRMVFMSDGGLRLMEINDFDEFRGRPWSDFWEGQGNLDAHQAIAAARNGHNASFTGSAKTMGGKLKWWHSQVSPVLGLDGKPEKILCVSRDITQLHDAEEALRTLNNSLEHRVQERTLDRDRLWRLSADLMVVAQFDGVMYALNPAWHEVLGWNEEQLLGNDFMHLVHPDDLDATRNAMTRLMNGQSISDFKNRYRHVDGAYRTIAWTAVPDQQFIHAVGRDVQAQEEASAALKVSEDALHQAQKLEAIGQLTGGVAHDFNNLLTIIKSCTDLLKSTQLSEAKRSKYIQAISSTVDRAARLTGQLLAFARRQALQPEVFDINESVRRIGEMMDTLTGSRVQVSIEVPQAPCCIHADGSQFDTALINMVVNARDAMAGVGQLNIRVERIDGSANPPLAALGSGEYVSISLTDTGSGIAADQIGLIFEPFYTTKAAGQGTGLGLSQVFGFAKQSGGEVAVHSELGNGSRFTLYLPSVQQLPEPRVRQSTPVTTAEAGLRILMVEDHPEIATYTSAMLEASGFEVLWVGGAKEALDHLEQAPERFDVVFSDIAMPGMSGIELYAEIEARWPALPVILTTGYSTEFAGFTREQAQRFDLLQKPYKMEELCARLHASVRRHRHSQ